MCRVNLIVEVGCLYLPCLEVLCFFLFSITKFLGAHVALWTALILKLTGGTFVEYLGGRILHLIVRLREILLTHLIIAYP